MPLPQHVRQVLILLGPTGVVAMLSCTDRLPSEPDAVEPRRSLVTGEVTQAVLPPELPFAEIASRAPSFGGFFVEADRLVGLVTDPSDADTVREELQRLRGRAPGAPRAVRTIEIRIADYAFTELAEWRDYALNQAVPIDGVVSLDLDERRNRVVIGVSSESAWRSVEQVLAELSAPPEAFVLESKVIVEQDTTLWDYFRPVRGGFRVTVVDQYSMNPEPCTLGFSARSGTDDVYTTASHCTAALWDLDGGGAFQPTKGTGWLGYESSDPDPFICAPATACRYSDVSLLEYGVSVDFDFGFLARPEALNSNVIASASSTFAITRKGDYPSLQQVVDKVGFFTGWTSGQVTHTCEHIAIGPYLRLCSYGADYNSHGGDSGSPVFSDNLDGSWTVTLMGSHFARDTVNEIAYFSPMGGIEDDFGALDVTDVPPPLVVDILGPSDVQPNYPCEWWADVSGGGGGYEYEWSGVLSGSGSSVSGSLSSSGRLYLTVTSGGQSDGDSKWITVSESAPTCGI